MRFTQLGAIIFTIWGAVFYMKGESIGAGGMLVISTILAIGSAIEEFMGES